MHKFIVGPCDTDSISFTKSDMSPFSKEERDALVKEINDISPEFMQWDDDGLYEMCIAVKAKNYVLWDGKKLVIKGSSLKATNKSPAMKEFMKELIQTMLDEKFDYTNIYLKYVKEILNITDIKRYALKKTITDKIFNSERANETKVLDAIGGDMTTFQEGDKVYMYYKPDESMALVENFDGTYHVDRLLKNLYDSAKCFETIIDVKATFPNYSLKKHKKELDLLK